MGDNEEGPGRTYESVDVVTPQDTTIYCSHEPDKNGEHTLFVYRFQPVFRVGGKDPVDPDYSRSLISVLARLEG
ncbi:MAG: hypothetical protein JRI97_04955 [Deltaproteobacteria bacterium]|nr:hypothetical protein [Deltaproteobacteria bacterium]